MKTNIVSLTSTYAGLVYTLSIFTPLLTLWIWRRRHSVRDTRDFDLTLELLALWAWCAALWLLAPPAWRWPLRRLAWLSASLLPVAWVRLAWAFAGKKTSQRYKYGWRWLLVIPLLTQLVIWTNPLHHWFWRDEISLTHIVWWAIPPHFYGPWFWLHTVYAYLLAALGIVPIFHIIQRSLYQYRQQAWLLLLTGLSFILSSTWVLFSPASQPHDPTVALGLGSFLLLLWHFLRHTTPGCRLFIPGTSYKNGLEGLIILDREHRIAAINCVAQLLLQLAPDQTIGEAAEQLFTPWTTWAPYIINPDPLHIELALDRGQQTQWLKVYKQPLSLGRQVPVGTLLRLQDISERKWTEQALQARRRELAELNTLSRVIAASLSLEEVLQSTVHAVMRLFPHASNAAVQLLDAEGHYLYTRTCANKTGKNYPFMKFKLGEGLAGIAAQTRSTLNVPDILEDSRYIHVKGETAYRSLLVTPLLFGAEVLGTLSVVAPARRAFSEDEAKLLEDLARFAAIAVQNAHLYEQAQAEIAERQQVTTALRQNELRYRALFENTNDAIFIISLEGKYLAANQRASDMLGYSLEELLVRDPLEIIVPEEHADARQRLEHLLNGATMPIYERRFRHKDGHILTTEINIALIRDPEGRPLHIQSVVRDITQRKAAEEALRQSEEKHRLLLDSIQSPVLALSHDMQILYCNTAYASYVNMLPETLSGKKLTTLFPQIHESRTYLAYRRCLETNQPQTIEGWLGERYFKTRIYPTPWGLLAIADDATSQRRAQDTLQQYAERLQVLHEIDRAILEAQSPEAIASATLPQIQRLIPCCRSLILEFEAPAQHKVLAWHSEAAFQAIPPAMWMAATGDQSAIPHPSHSLWVEDLEALPTRSPWQEQLLQEGIHAYLWMPLVALDRSIGLLCLEFDRPWNFHDEHIKIAAEVATSLALALHQARLHQQTQQDAIIKSNLIDKINHRVKNNLASIIGLLFMTQRYLKPEAQMICAPTLEQFANRIHALSIVHQMLSEAEWQLLPLSELAERLIHAILQSLDVAPQITLTVSPSPVKVDSRQANSLALILHELVMNTIMHGLNQRHAAHIRLQIETETPGPKDTPLGVRLEYQDDGPGYPTAVLNEGKQRMGLYLIQRLTNINLYGVVTFDNAPGARATVRFAACVQQDYPQET